jgi:uncharacterized phage protein (TIGR01671 family)
MNREIKFRFWTGKEMLDWLCVCQTAFNEFNVVYEYNQIKKDQESKDNLSQAFDSMLSHGELIRSGLMYKLFTSFKVTAMQFIGLEDKNGKEVYEGDIIKYQHSKDSKEYTGEIYYKSESGCFYIKTSDESGFALLGHQKIIEVIGNIYETPKLTNQ